MPETFDTYWELIDDIDLLNDILDPNLEPTQHLDYHRKKCYDVLVKRLKSRRNEYIEGSR